MHIKEIVLDDIFIGKLINYKLLQFFQGVNLFELLIDRHVYLIANILFWFVNFIFVN